MSGLLLHPLDVNNHGIPVGKERPLLFWERLFSWSFKG